MIDRKFCSNCGGLTYPGPTFCQKCGAAFAGMPPSDNSQMLPPSWKLRGVYVEQFKSTKDFKNWQEAMGARIKILKVIPYALPWLTKCYTVTYELFACEMPSPKLAPFLEIQTR
jgi:hypothetical protein